jgi:hypothetical protein
MEQAVTAEHGPLRNVLAAARTGDGRSLLELSERTPLLLVFLRHFG